MTTINRVLVACECSGKVRDAFIEKGCDAWSCDYRDGEGKYTKNHIKGNVLNVLDDGWDLMIAHPPCTYLANSSIQHLEKEEDLDSDEDRWLDFIRGAKFFKKLLRYSNIPHRCIENPVMHPYAKKFIQNQQTQVIQPYQFGHLEYKTTCLWLSRLPKLKPTSDLKEETDKLPPKKRQRLWYYQKDDRSKVRSVTFDGIALAMADQWHDLPLDYGKPYNNEEFLSWFKPNASGA